MKPRIVLAIDQRDVSDHLYMLSKDKVSKINYQESSYEDKLGNRYYVIWDHNRLLGLEIEGFEYTVSFRNRYQHAIDLILNALQRIR